MSIFASILHMAYKLSGAKKAFALPEDALQKEIEKREQEKFKYKKYYIIYKKNLIENAYNKFPAL